MEDALPSSISTNLDKLIKLHLAKLKPKGEEKGKKKEGKMLCHHQPQPNLPNLKPNFYELVTINLVQGIQLCIVSCEGEKLLLKC